MEQLLGDIEPPKDKVFDDLSKELRDSLVCPVLMGSAIRTNGVLRLMKALRHEAPDVATTVKRLGVKAGSDPIAYVSQDAAHGARRQDVGRAHAQRPGRGRHDLPDARARGRPRRRRLQAHGPGHREARPRRRRRNRRARQARPCHDRRHHHRRQERACGVADDRADAAGARHRGLRQGAQGRRQARPGFAQAAGGRPFGHDGPQSRSARGRASGARARCICGSRPSGWPIASASPSRPASPASATARPSRSRSSSADATRSNPAVTASTATWCVDIKPMPRGAGFAFEEAIKGGVVPRNYIPSVEEGVQDALKHGPLGFPVVDVAVKLIDGSYHTVDSSDMAFQLAGRLAMNRRACRSASRCCSSRSIRSTSCVRRRRPPR